MEIIINKNFREYEVDLLKHYLSKYKFFKDHGYTCSYPTEEEFKDILKKTEEGSLIELDFDQVPVLFNKIADEKLYKIAFEKMEEMVPNINGLLNKKHSLFLKLQKAWGFRIFENYQIEITNYGPGGSYNCYEGVVIFALWNRRLVSTPIHEIVHIGIEVPIIKKYSINQATKEYLVDMFVKSNFGEYLPNYKIQKLRYSDPDQEVVDLITLDFNWEQLDKELGLIYNTKTKTLK